MRESLSYKWMIIYDQLICCNVEETHSLGSRRNGLWFLEGGNLHNEKRKKVINGLLSLLSWVYQQVEERCITRVMILNA